MAIFKCKMCGGELDVDGNSTVVTCDYCGTKQTVPTSYDEEIRSLYNRANILRMKSEFDKAEQLYEKILGKDDKQAEAYWGVLLCKYGIEYVEDPKTGKRIPTCHRTSFDAITADEYYKLALDNADSVQQGIYESEAKYIDGVQKEILAISQKEEPYDVFICYKETDENGKRTQDSVIANDIYYQLTQEGYKVFYAAITLEDKLGSAYEPIIFAALNSAKVMLSIGTKPEYFTAVWVKNEWSRYLKLMQKDHTKMLIPCYKDMDAYELPEEFAHLQAQDMGKIGFINDIVRGIKKVIVKSKLEQKSTASIANSNVANLLKRAYMYAEDGDFENANIYAEKILDIDSEFAEAYVVKLMCNLKQRKQEDLATLMTTFEDNNNYHKAMRFGNNELKEKLNSYIVAINENQIRYKNEQQYKKATELMDSQSVDDVENARQIFLSISDWKDSKDLVEKCVELVTKIQKDEIYSEATANFQSVDISSVQKAKELFESISDWKDSDNKIAECDARIEELLRQELITKMSEAQKRKKDKKIAAIVIPIVTVIVILIIVFAAISANKSAAEEQADLEIRNGLKLTLSENSDYYIVNGIESNNSTEIIIPDTYKDLPIKEISDNAFKGCSNITSVTISNNITMIGEHAFFNCTNLTNLVIPDSVVSIGYGTFSGCSSLESITLPFVGDKIRASTDEYLYPFGYIFGSLKYTGGDATKQKCFEGDRSKSVTNTYYIPSSLKNVTITGGNILTYAFYDCNNITHIILQNGVESIGYNAFYSCDGLMDITIPNSVKSIASNAFLGCDSINAVYINSLDSWCNIKFTDSDSNPLNSAKNLYLNNSLVTNLIIPNSVTTIGDNTFVGCESIKSVTIHNKVKTIGNSAFWYCKNLTNITIPDSVTSIGDYAFSNCKSFTSVNIKNGQLKKSAAEYNVI